MGGDNKKSPLTQGRGLKSVKIKTTKEYKVAPHAGAWIEIIDGETYNKIKLSPLTQGRGLKYKHKTLPCRAACRPSRRGVD